MMGDDDVYWVMGVERRGAIGLWVCEYFEINKKT
jgi:hypothetical protein